MPSGLTGGWNETPKYRMVHRPETYSRVYWGGLGLGVICMKVDWINIQHITQTEKSCEGVGLAVCEEYRVGVVAL